MIRQSYPLMPETTEDAKRLVTAFRDGQIPSEFTMHPLNTLSGGRKLYLPGRGVPDNFDLPSGSSLEELAYYKLIILDRIQGQHDAILRVVLLQELINAVENDFLLTDYALLNSPAQLAEVLNGMLSGLSTYNSEIADAIRDLADSKEETRVDAVRKVLGAITSAIEVGANIVTIAPGLVLLGQYLQRGL